MRSPVHAILWELWRVTRFDAAWKFGAGIVGGLAVLGVSAAFPPAGDAGAAIALTMLVVPHLMGWPSLSTRLNGGKPGFPFHLHYTHPVRTTVAVGLPMAYLTIASASIYLVSALLLRLVSAHAFPLLPVAAWIAALTLVFMAAVWSTRRHPVLVALVAMVAAGRSLGLAVDRLTAVEIPHTFDWPPHLWPMLFDWPLTDYAWIALIAATSFVFTSAMVARQRRGDDLPVPAWTPGGGWSLSRISTVFRFPCPTSSATRAQLWLDLRSNGLPVLTIGVAMAVLIVLASAVSGPLDAAWNADPGVPCPIEECFWARAFPPLIAPLSVVLVLGLAGNAFGIRRRQDTRSSARSRPRARTARRGWPPSSCS